MTTFIIVTRGCVGVLAACLIASSVLSQEPSPSLSDQLASSDADTALQLLKRAQATKDSPVVIAGLSHPNLLVRKNAAEVASALGIRQAIPGLLKAWDENKDRYTGGAETQLAQRELNQSLAVALAKLTDQTVTLSASLTAAQMSAIAQTAQEWIVSHNP